MTQLKERKNIKSYYGRLTCHEQFENSSRLGVLNDRDQDPYICIVQSDRLILKYVAGCWLKFVYVSKRTSSSNILLLDFSFPSISSFSVLPTEKQMMCRWSRKEVE